jgi:hypothetical protein
MSKLSYKQLVATNLLRHNAYPGDELTLTIRNEENDEGIYAQAQRLWKMFTQCYYFYPQSISIHSEHLAILKKQGKSLDIMLSEEGAQRFGEEIDLTSLPRTIPLLADDSLDLFTTVARFTFREEDGGEMLADALLSLLHLLGDRP